MTWTALHLYHFVYFYYSTSCCFCISPPLSLYALCLQTKGELSEDHKQRLETAQQTFQKLWHNAALYADLVDEVMPELPPEVIKEDDVMSINFFSADSQVRFIGVLVLIEKTVVHPT